MNSDVTRLAGLEEFTGRQLVLLNEDNLDASARALRDCVGARITRVSEGEDAAQAIETLSSSDGVVLESLGIALVNADSAALSALEAGVADAGVPIEHISPERYVYALSVLDEYLRGYQDGTNQLIARLRTSGAAGEAAVQAVSEAQSTWGLQATRTTLSRFSGQGIKVAVLDTGLDLTHPDFAGRAITSKSFVAGQAVQDGNGHGTHCIGTSCGPRTPPTLPRYGVAYNAEIFAGKVLSNTGRGTQGGILAGIDWAIQNACQVISMSLGSPASIGAIPDRAYERAGRKALQAGSLIVAAAGNESERPGFIAPVGFPANSLSIMAVAALDINLAIASFSCGGLNPGGGGVDIAGPGVNVYSSVPGGHARFNGTSMATPHVAGIAALHAEATGLRGAALWTRLIQTARRMNLPSRDVGIGLVQAP
jgi:subtilisin family serine protease